MSSENVASAFKPVLLSMKWDLQTIRIEFWDGSMLGSSDAKATVRMRSPEAIRHIIYAPGELGATRAIVTGEIDFDGDMYYAISHFMKSDLAPQQIGIRSLAKTARSLRDMGVYGKAPAVPLEEVTTKGRRHSQQRDARAISHHYDVGNEFYRIVLGETMTYSCARYESEVDSLEDAQRSKWDLICRKLGLQSGMRYLDVGCGWGGMLIHAAREYGVEAVGITLSREQAQLAQKRITEAGLSDRIEIRIQDYRDLRKERFDAISSVGMFEHVGKTRIAHYFATLHTALHDEGRLLHHAIDKPSGSIMHPKGFIARYVFPDGELQDLSTAIDTMQTAGFEVRDVESLREHYARTLRAWVANLEANWGTCVDLVGANRARVWKLYMMGSAVSFETNRISIHQTIGVRTPHSGSSGMPLTRQAFV